jgi:hypothetical protein
MIEPIENSERVSKPLEIKIADTRFIRINSRKNHFQFTDLRDRHTHYSAWFYDSTFDLHKTLEPHDSLSKRQIPIVKMPFNMETCMDGIRYQ